MISVSKRLLSVPASPIRKLVPYAQKAKAEGVKVYHFNIGDPDIESPNVMIDALRSWDKNPIGYSLSQGEPVFLEALKWYYHSIGFPFVDIANIQVTLGGSEAIAWAMFAVANPKEEILVFEPFYANYNTYAAVNGITLKPIKTDISHGFHLPSGRIIEGYITEKTKAILYCNPSNPTGTVYTKEEVETLVQIAKKFNLYLLSDEVYREFTYDGRKHISLLSYMKQIPDQAIVLDSLSKRYSICGARLGCMVSLHTELMQGVLRIGMGRLSAGSVDQIMASKLVDVPATYFTSVQKEYAKRRDTLYDGLKSIPGVEVPKPEGAFYCIVKLPVTNAEDFCTWLLTDFRDNNETLMMAPAAGFYATKGLGENEVRIAYVLNVSSIERSIEILKKALRVFQEKDR